MRIRSLAALSISALALLVVSASCGGNDGSVADSANPGAPGAEAGAPAPEGGNATSDGATSDTSTPSPGCTGKTGKVGDRTVTITSGGQQRSFDLHVPANYDPSKAAPLVFLFHGYTMTASGIAAATHFAKTADARGMIVAFPSGIDNSFNAGDCCGTAVTNKVDDVGFTRDMITSLEGEYCVDPKRVFSTGFSNGGFLSYFLACELADRIAAVAAVSGGLRVEPAACKPKRPIALLHVHGTGDIVVPYNGGGLGNARPVVESVGAFRTKNACAAGDGKVVFTKGDVSCTKWDGCTAGADVELCTVTNGGHQWPGGEQLPYGGSPSPDLNASEAVADFLEAHPLP